MPGLGPGIYAATPRKDCRVGVTPRRGHRGKPTPGNDEFKTRLNSIETWFGVNGAVSPLNRTHTHHERSHPTFDCSLDSSRLQHSDYRLYLQSV
jgi:hypothetical protein